MNGDEEVKRLAHEIEEAEIFLLKLRARFVTVRDALAIGRAAEALSLCNQTLNEIDNQTDVVVPSPPSQTR